MVYNDLELVADDWSDKTDNVMFKAVFRKHEERMSNIFNYYAGASTRAAGRPAAARAAAADESACLRSHRRGRVAAGIGSQRHDEH